MEAQLELTRLELANRKRDERRARLPYRCVARQHRASTQKPVVGRARLSCVARQNVCSHALSLTVYSTHTPPSNVPQIPERHGDGGNSQRHCQGKGLDVGPGVSERQSQFQSQFGLVRRGEALCALML